MLQIIKKCILCLFSLVYQVIAQLIIQQYFVAKAMPFLYHIMAYSRRGEHCVKSNKVYKLYKDIVYTFALGSLCNLYTLLAIIV